MTGALAFQKVNASGADMLSAGFDGGWFDCLACIQRSQKTTISIEFAPIEILSAILIMDIF